MIWWKVKGGGNIFREIFEMEKFQLKSNFSRFFDFRKILENMFMTLHFSSYHFLLETNFWIRFFAKFLSTERGSFKNDGIAGFSTSRAGFYFYHWGAPRGTRFVELATYGAGVVDKKHENLTQQHIRYLTSSYSYVFKLKTQNLWYLRENTELECSPPSIDFHSIRTLYGCLWTLEIENNCPEHRQCHASGLGVSWRSHIGLHHRTPTARHHRIQLSIFP